MAKEIPHIKFNSEAHERMGFEIVPLEKIAAEKESYKVDPEKPHQLKFYNLIFFTEGESEHLVDFQWYPVRKNTLIYLTKEQVNAFKFVSGLRGYCMIFTSEFFAKSFSHLPEDFIFRLFTPHLFSPILQVPVQSEFEEYFNLLNQEFNKSSSFNYETILESLFVVLLSKAEQLKQNQTFYLNDSAKVNLFQKFNKLLEQYYTTSRSAHFYAKELAISYKHLNVVCKDLTNLTAKVHIDNYLILQAKRNLINSDMKSSELAYKLGFEDPTNFGKYFKKSTGLTPIQFKKIHK